MAFRNAATTVVARVFKLLDSNGFTRILLAALTRTGFAGYALLYDDPTYNLTTEGAGVWFQDGATDPRVQLFASQNGSIEAYVEANTIEAFSESGVLVVASSPPKTASILVDATAARATIQFSCDDFGGWTALPFAGNWANRGGGFQTCQYRKVGDMIQIRGNAISTGVNAGFTAMGTLPVGFRPPLSENIVVEQNGIFAVIVVTSAGSILITVGTAGAGVPLSLNCQVYTST